MMVVRLSTIASSIGPSIVRRRPGVGCGAGLSCRLAPANTGVISAIVSRRPLLHQYRDQMQVDQQMWIDQTSQLFESNGHLLHFVTVIYTQYAFMTGAAPSMTRPQRRRSRIQPFPEMPRHRACSRPFLGDWMMVQQLAVHDGDPPCLGCGIRGSAPGCPTALALASAGPGASEGSIAASEALSDSGRRIHRCEPWPFPARPSCHLNSSFLRE